MPFIGLLTHFTEVLQGNQNNNALHERLGAPLTINTYNNIIKPFIRTKTAPDNLSDEIHTKANTEAVIMILDKSGIIKHITNKFYLSSMQMSMREKFQLMETFGAANISFFGEAARVYVFMASTVDSASQDSGVSSGKYYYQSSILKMYNSVLRGSQLIKDDRIAVMKVNNHLIYGYPLNLQISYNAAADPVTNFVLQFVVSEHSLELPGIVSEAYLEKMYSPDAHINSEAILNFVIRIDGILSKINNVLSTNVKGEDYNSAGAIENIQDASFSWYNYQPDNMKSAYTALLLANVSALNTAFGSTLDGEISPLVHSKVPVNTIDRLLAMIPSMFDNEDTFNFVATNLRNLIVLKKELVVFRSYRMSRGEA